MSVCENQDDFNRAFYKAIKYTRKEDTKKTGAVMTVAAIIYMVLLVWAILLAFKQPVQNRVVHVTLALVFGPAYILAYYLSAFQ